MDLYIGADHQGFELKQELVSWLQSTGHTVHDVGPGQMQVGDDYPDVAFQVAQEVAQDASSRRGILLCGSGVGMAVAANKVKGVRAALIHDPDIARAGQRDDDINVLALGAAYVTPNQAREVITAWLDTSFSPEERYVRRIDKIKHYEEEHQS